MHESQFNHCNRSIIQFQEEPCSSRPFEEVILWCKTGLGRSSVHERQFNAGDAWPLNPFGPSERVSSNGSWLNRAGLVDLDIFTDQLAGSFC